MPLNKKKTSIILKSSIEHYLYFFKHFYQLLFSAILLVSWCEFFINTTLYTFKDLIPTNMTEGRLKSFPKRLTILAKLATTNMKWGVADYFYAFLAILQPVYNIYMGP